MDKIDLVKSKIMDRDLLKRILGVWRFQDKKIVFTNGCFDILHKGHIHLLTQAAMYGNILIVGLNSDTSVKSIKGSDRPFNDEETRSWILGSFSFVNAVVLFEEDTPLELIKFVNPNVIVKGGDYSENEIVGADIVKSNGGEVKIIPLLEGFSSTGIEQKLNQKV